MDQAELLTLQARLTQVEHRLRATRTGWLVSVVVFTLLGMGVRQAAPQSAMGPARGHGGGEAAGTVRIGFNVHSEGAEVMLADAAGKGRIWLNVKPDGTPGAVFTDSTGKGRIWITAHPDRPAGLILSDGTGRGRIWIGAFNDTSTGPVLGGQTAEVLFQAP